MPGRKALNSYQPFALSGSSALMIAATLGTLAGLYLFLRGFFLLQHRPAPSAASAPTAATAITITTTTTFSTKGTDTLTPDSHGEVIRLTPAGNQTASAASMSQQGKIAAALIKAGIPNPASWSTPDPARVAVQVADRPSKEMNAPAPQTPELNLTKLRTNGSAAPSPRLDPQSAPVAKAPGIPAAGMLWGGALLALTSIYLLAAHFRWL